MPPVAGMDAAKSCTDAAGSYRGSNRLSTPSWVDAAFEVRQCRKYVLEGGWLREVHVPHRLVITPKCRQTRCRWDEEDRSRLRVLVVCPRSAEELSLPPRNPVPEVMIVDCPAHGRMPGQRRCIRVVARESIRRRLIGWESTHSLKDALPQ